MGVSCSGLPTHLLRAHSGGKLPVATPPIQDVVLTLVQLHDGPDEAGGLVVGAVGCLFLSIQRGQEKRIVPLVPPPDHHEGPSLHCPPREG